MIILHFLAICSTILRIWIQQRTRKLWWDDYLVALPAAFDIFFCITLFVYPPIEPSETTLFTFLLALAELSLFAFRIHHNGHSGIRKLLAIFVSKLHGSMVSYLEHPQET
jgi:hypothetical protein